MTDVPLSSPPAAGAAIAPQMTGVVIAKAIETLSAEETLRLAMPKQSWPYPYVAPDGKAYCYVSLNDHTALDDLQRARQALQDGYPQQPSQQKTGDLLRRTGDRKDMLKNFLVTSVATAVVGALHYALSDASPGKMIAMAQSVLQTPEDKAPLKIMGGIFLTGSVALLTGAAITYQQFRQTASTLVAEQEKSTAAHDRAMENVLHFIARHPDQDRFAAQKHPMTESTPPAVTPEAPQRAKEFALAMTA